MVHLIYSFITTASVFPGFPSHKWECMGVCVYTIQVLIWKQTRFEEASREQHNKSSSKQPLIGTQIIYNNNFSLHIYQGESLHG